MTDRSQSDRSARSGIALSPLLAASFAIFGMPEGAGAQAAAEVVPNEASEATLEEIVVTADKRTSTVQDVPLAVTAMSGESMARKRIDSLDDIQQSVPNLIVTENTALGQPYIRGVGNEILASQNDSAVATHLDGVYIPRGASLLFDFYDVDRVEVLRGPQGTLYGRNATGGAINVLTRAATFEPEANVAVSVGNYNDRRISAAGSTAVVPDTLALRGAVLAEQRDGFQTNVFNGDDLGDKDVLAGRVSGKYLAGAWEITLTGDYTKDDSTGNATRELSGNPALAPVRLAGGTSTARFFDVNLDTSTAQRIRNGGLNLTMRTGDEQLGFTSITGYRRSQFQLTLDQDATQIPGIAGDTENQNSTSVSQEFQVAGQASNLEYIAGLYYFREHASDNHHFVFGVPFTLVGFQDLVYNAAGTTNAYAVFGQAKYAITPALSATVGVRYGYEEKESETRNVFNFASLPTGKQRIDSDSFTPKFELQYRFSDDVNSYLSATKGFKSGGVNTLSLTNEEYGGETLWSYELGLKADWLQRRVRTNLATFFYDYQNMQVNTYSGIGTLVENAGFATIKGAELELQIAPVRQFRLDGQISYLDATFDKYVTLNPDDPGAGLQDLEGNRLPRAPKLSYSVGAQSDLDLSDRFVLSLRGEYQWRDDVFYSQFENPLVGQRSFSLANASVSLSPSDGRYSITAWGRNLGNTEWFAFVGSSPGTTGVQGIPAAPRTYGVTLSYNFD